MQPGADLGGKSTFFCQVLYKFYRFCWENGTCKYTPNPNLLCLATKRLRDGVRCLCSCIRDVREGYC